MTTDSAVFALVSSPELLIFLAVLVVLFGASQIPKIARSLGQAQKEFKQGQKEDTGEKESSKSPDA